MQRRQAADERRHATPLRNGIDIGPVITYVLYQLGLPDGSDKHQSRDPALGPRVDFQAACQQLLEQIQPAPAGRFAESRRSQTCGSALADKLLNGLAISYSIR